MRLILELAVTHIVGRGRQTVVALIGVALGVGFSIAMAALMQGTQDDFVETMIDTMPHVEISDETRDARRQPAEDVYGTTAFLGLRPRDDQRGIRNPTAALAGLRSWVPGLATPSLSTQGVVRYAGRDAAVSIIGVEPASEARVSSLGEDFKEGDFAALASGGNNIIVGDTLAEKLGADYGTTITVVSSTGLQQGLKIVGIFHSGVQPRDEGETYVLLKNAQILSERPNAINRIRIKLDNPDNARPLAARIEAQIGYKAVSWQEANESILEALVVRNVIMYTVVAAILLVAGFGIFNIISTITHEKARDIAILKSLGFQEGDMRRLFLIEGLAIGAAGSALGWAVGFLLTLTLGRIHFEIPEADMTNLPLTWSVWHYLIASCFALGSAGIAGYLPARKAARLNPVDIIRGAT
jgi:lipoprotein-releasing system permease protein